MGGRGEPGWEKDVDWGGVGRKWDVEGQRVSDIHSFVTVRSSSHLTILNFTLQITQGREGPYNNPVR